VKVQLDAPGKQFNEDVVLALIPREGDTIEWKNDSDDSRTFRVHHVVWFVGDAEPIVRLVIR